MRRTIVLALVLVAALAEHAAAATVAQLLSRHEPVLVLHPDERFRPTSVEQFLAGGRLEQRFADNTWSPVLPVGGLPVSDPPTCPRKPCWRLDFSACTVAGGLPSVDCYAAAERARPAPNVVYAAALTSGNRIVLEYWYWYSYDFWSGDHPPSNRVWQAHEGDWEVVVVVLTRAGKPLLAGYSQHSCGKRRAWSRVPKSRRTHPLVFVALGSHANYFRAGDQRMDLREQCYDPAGAALLSAALPGGVFDRLDNGPRIATRIVRVKATSPSWMRFAGAWGEPSLFYPGGVRVYPYGFGPVGPAFHDVWLDPLRTLARWPTG